jgi:hypothetical protein
MSNKELIAIMVTECGADIATALWGVKNMKGGAYNNDSRKIYL